MFSKCAWFYPLENKKGITITNASQNTLNGPSCKPNKILVVKGSKCYKISSHGFQAVTQKSVQHISTVRTKILKV